MSAESVAQQLLETEALPLSVQAVLTGSSQRELLRRIAAIHPNVRAHHATLAFAPTPAQYNEVVKHCPIGSLLQLRVIGEARDDLGQAVVVHSACPLGLNKVPHITISFAEGSSARYSNDLLERGYNRIDPFDLWAIVEHEELSASKS